MQMSKDSTRLRRFNKLSVVVFHNEEFEYEKYLVGDISIEK